MLRNMWKELHFQCNSWILINKDWKYLSAGLFLVLVSQNQIKDNKNSYITENFFKINNELIHEDLKYSLPLSDNSKMLFEDMKKHDSIALHILQGTMKIILNSVYAWLSSIIMQFLCLVWNLKILNSIFSQKTLTGLMKT